MPKRPAHGPPEDGRSGAGRKVASSAPHPTCPAYLDWFFLHLLHRAALDQAVSRRRSAYTAGRGPAKRSHGDWARNGLACASDVTPPWESRPARCRCPTLVILHGDVTSACPTMRTARPAPPPIRDPSVRPRRMLTIRSPAEHLRRPRPEPPPFCSPLGCALLAPACRAPPHLGTRNEPQSAGRLFIYPSSPNPAPGHVQAATLRESPASLPQALQPGTSRIDWFTVDPGRRAKTSARGRAPSTRSRQRCRTRASHFESVAGPITTLFRVLLFFALRPRMATRSLFNNFGA